MPDEVTMARLGLLDALAALESHLDALVIIGAHSFSTHGSSALSTGGGAMHPKGCSPCA